MYMNPALPYSDGGSGISFIIRLVFNWQRRGSGALLSFRLNFTAFKKTIEF